MAAWRQAIELAIGEEDLAALRAIARSRTEPARRVERARMVLAYREDPSFFAVGRALGVHHQTVERCVERALAYGPMAALDDRPRPGRSRPSRRGQGMAGGAGLPQGERPWLSPRTVDDPASRPPCPRARTGRRASVPRRSGAGHGVQDPDQDEVKRHKVRTYLERRDPEFTEKMAEVLCVYREVKILKQRGPKDGAERRGGDRLL